jgi:hypothetical protein
MTAVIQPGDEPIPGYKVLQQLGRGGFGEVWKAEGPGGAPKAIKVLHGTLDNLDARARSRVSQELKSLRRIQMIRHPFLLSLERYDIIDGRLFVVTELADRSLWDRFEECRALNQPGIPRDELLHYLLEAAEALDLLNQRHHLQHLDIKPQNLLLLHNHIKVADFGLVKYLEETSVTRTGGFTPAYGAPELFRGVVSHFCDQYSLAIVFQEMLTGQRPFASNRPAELARQHLSQPPDLSALPPGDRAAIGRALAKEAEARHPSCTDLLRSLQPLTPTRAPVALDSTPRLEPAPTAAEIVRGKGLLAPTFVIGLGGQGLHTLHALRRMIHERFGTVRSLPNVRMLLLDTDPDVAPTAGEMIRPERVLLAPLQRPQHYFQGSADRVPIDWLDAKLIHQMPRAPRTGGWRGLGRLALADHGPTILRWLRDELKVCTSTTALEAADRQSGLGLRSTQPRVYIVASLGGGTGSGMFVDVAYLVRKALQSLDSVEAEIVGLFSLASAIGSGASRALANSVAALIELHHFSAPGATFHGRYRGDLEIRGSTMPFQRCCLLAPGPDEAATTALRAAEFIYCELTTTLARRGMELVDTSTQPSDTASTAPELPRQGLAMPPPALATFGLQRFAWPRRQVIKQCARTLAARLLRTWTEPAAGNVETEVRSTFHDQWAERGLGPEALLAHLEEACVRAIGAAPLETVATWIDEASARLAAAPATIRTEAATLHQRIGELLGPPRESTGRQSALASPLRRALDDALVEWTSEWRERWRELAWSLVDQPVRFAGAEAAARIAQDIVRHTLQHHRNLAGDHMTKAERAGQQLTTVLRPPTGRSAREAPRAADVLQVISHYAEACYQGKLLDGVVHVFRSGQEVILDCQRELDVARAELKNGVRDMDAAEPTAAPESAGGGFVADAGYRAAEVRRFLDGLSTADFEALGRDVQAMIHKQYDSLAELCLRVSWSNRFQNLAATVQSCAEVFVQDRIGFPDVIDKFRDRNPGAEEVRQAFGDACARARSDLGRGSTSEAWFVAMPARPSRDALWEMARSALPATPTVVDSMNDIVVYVEQARSYAALADQLSPAAWRAYEQALQQPVSPHVRSDVVVWLPLPGEAEGAADGTDRSVSR